MTYLTKRFGLNLTGQLTRSLYQSADVNSAVQFAPIVDKMDNCYAVKRFKPK